MQFIEKESGLKGKACFIYCNNGRKQYLSMIESYMGLLVFHEDEIDIVNNYECELVEFRDKVTQKYEKMHPVLLEILKENWGMYINIVEGVPEFWDVFIKRMHNFDTSNVVI